MNFNRFRPIALSIIAALIACNAPSHAQGLQQPQDTTNAIPGYELLGVRLGMSEAEAVAAVKSRFPAGSQNASGRLIHLLVTDYELISPNTTDAKL